MKPDKKSFRIGLSPGSILGLCLFGIVWMLEPAWALAASATPDDLKPRLSSTAVPRVGDVAVTTVLQPIREKFDVPAMAAAVVTSEGLQWVGAIGFRKRGSSLPVTRNDLWHLGSETKAMTAALVGRLIDQGRLKWTTSMADVFPELSSKMHPDFRDVTLLHLLSHRAGLPANLDLARFQGVNRRTLRLRAVKEELAKSPQHKPGSAFEYSNVGYIVAGAVVEKVTHRSWEDLIQSELFQPLHMVAGFGGLGTPGVLDQPWPHTSDGSPTAINGPRMDNPPVMGPAGRVHSSIQEWAKFIRDQLRGAQGMPGILRSETYQKLHSPPFDGNYALGWIAADRAWGGGKVFNHTGDNTMNFANVWMAPRRDFAILVCINQSGDTAFKASDAAVEALLKLWSEKHSPTDR